MNMQIPIKGNIYGNNRDVSDDRPLSVIAGTPTILKGADVIVPDSADGIILLATGAIETNATRAMVVNNGLKTIYINSTDAVTSENGLPLTVGQSWQFLPDESPYAICASGETSTVRVVQFK